MTGASWIEESNMKIDHVMPDCACSGKKCTECKQIKCIQSFSFNTHKDKRRRARCKVCCRTYNKQHGKVYKRTKERNLEIFRKHKYGISSSETLTLYNLQHGLCAICNSPLGTFNQYTVDHCHTTNKVRGLLCRKCNTGLGHFGDNPVLLQRAIDYLTEKVGEAN